MDEFDALGEHCLLLKQLLDIAAQCGRERTCLACALIERLHVPIVAEMTVKSTRRCTVGSPPVFDLVATLFHNSFSLTSMGWLDRFPGA